MEPFYILWNPKGRTPPRVEFITLDEAERAAKTMARVHPGQEFYVMQMVGKAVLPQQEPTYVKAGLSNIGNAAYRQIQANLRQKQAQEQYLTRWGIPGSSSFPG